MTCAGFLDRFSDYYDGLLPPEAAAEFDVHRATCTACAEYARVLDRSLGLLRSFEEVEPAPDLKERIQYRIQVDDDIERIGFGPLGSAAGTGAVALLAVVFSFSAWAPSLVRDSAQDTAGPLVATSQLPAAADQGSEDVGVEDDIELAPFAAGQLGAGDEQLSHLWVYPNAMLYEYSALSGRNRTREPEPAFVRAVGLE